MERIRLDIIPKGLMPVCHASQYDAGRIIRLDLMDGLQGYSLTDEEIELNVRKPDGHIVTASVDVVEGQTYVDIVTTEQMCAVGGENICELKISKDDAEIYSLNFRMMVEKSVTEGGDPSESFVYNLRTQIAEGVAEEVAEQYDSANVIFDNEPTDNHGIGYTVTSEGIKTAIDNAFDYDNTASGSLVHITDGADNIPVKSLVSQIVAVESGNGEKSPDNPYSISGFDNGIITRCGKNLFNADKIVSDSGHSSYVYIDNGYLRFTTGNPETNNIVWKNLRFPCPMKFTGTVKNFDTTDSGAVNIRVYFADGTNISLTLSSSLSPSTERQFDRTIGTTGQTITEIRGVWVGSKTVGLDLSVTQLELGDTATTFEAYNGNTYTFTFGQTVFGGYFDNKGNLVVTHSVVDLSDITSGGTAGSGYVWYMTLTNPKTVPNTQIAPITSEKYNAIRYNAVASNVNTIAIRDNGVVYVNNGSDTIQPSGIAVYELANPITLSITSQDIPTLLGENNIFSNTGDVEVNYYTNKANDILEFVDSEIGKKNGTNIPIEENSQDSIKDYIDDEVSSTKDYVDNGLSGKEDSLNYESDDYNVATYGGVIRCKKWGRMVNIQGYGLGTVTNMSTVQAYTMATIASKYCPTVQQHIIGSMNVGSYATSSTQGYRINTDGTVATYVYSGTKIENGYFNVTYMV